MAVIYSEVNSAIGEQIVLIGDIVVWKTIGAITTCFRARTWYGGSVTP